MLFEALISLIITLNNYRS
ncbi:Protein of unknown function [Leuconostoc citreum]|nr:Protein of unknown function [Leuconostoc citreum LBAE C10]CCF25990.1 Protein of unknown function [Leuconostoc citreum LBAE C11]CCF28322.1 Protein of unknown function [Leuconostoc citreum LBAE E16]CDX64119.1 Protein of unknown function [Leuconostoc citreum]CDX65837.1 Protein of unknown function [Leuconostoc citreum]